MAIILKALKVGKITATAEGSIQELYKAPDTTGQQKTAIVKAMRFVNPSSSANSINLRFTSGANSSKISPVALSIPANGMYVDDSEITLDAADKIEGWAGSATSGQELQFVISGIERDK